MSTSHVSDPKASALRRHGTVCPHPDQISDPLFQENLFFDARDLMQVKYEMLRRVAHDQVPVTTAAHSFGFSRVAFYQTKKRFEEAGLPGLLPERRGPKCAHKLTDEALDYAEELLQRDSSMTGAALAALIEERFGIAVYPSSVRRALKRRSKRGR